MDLSVAGPPSNQKQTPYATQPLSVLPELTQCEVWTTHLPLLLAAPLALSTAQY